MDASVEEADSSASSASSDRPSAVLPIVRPPEDSSHGSRERKNPFSKFYSFIFIQNFVYIIVIYNIYIFYI